MKKKYNYIRVSILFSFLLVGCESKGSLSHLTPTNPNIQENPTNEVSNKNDHFDNSQIKTIIQQRDRFLVVAKTLELLEPGTTTHPFQPLKWQENKAIPELNKDQTVEINGDTLTITRTKQFSQEEGALYSYLRNDFSNEDTKTFQELYKQLNISYRLQEETYYPLALTTSLGYSFLSDISDMEVVKNEYSTFLKQYLIFNVMTGKQIEKNILSETTIETPIESELFLFSDIENRELLGKLTFSYQFNANNLTLTIKQSFSKRTLEIEDEYQEISNINEPIIADFDVSTK